MCNEKSEQSAQTTFLERWSKIRKTAELVLTGPRSLLPASNPTGSDSWLEPDVRCEESGPGPLDRKSFSVFCRPKCLGDSHQTATVLRTVVWYGVKDKSACLTQNLGYPTVGINFHTCKDTEIARLNESLSALDSSLRAFSPDIEKIIPYMPPDLNIVQTLPPNGGLFQLKIHRRFYYSSCDFTWQENKDAPTNMGGTYEKFTSLLSELSLQPSDNGNSDWVERYDMLPQNYMKCLGETKLLPVPPVNSIREAGQET